MKRFALAAICLLGIALSLISLGGAADTTASNFKAAEWSEIAHGTLADAFVENKLYRSEDSANVLLHVCVRNKTKGALGIDTDRRFWPLHKWTSDNLGGGTMIDRNGWSENYVDALDWHEFLGGAPDLPRLGKTNAKFASGKMYLLPADEIYDYYVPFGGCSCEDVEHDFKQISFKNLVVTMTSEMELSNGVIAELLTARSPWYVCLFGGAKGAQISFAAPIAWHKPSLNSFKNLADLDIPRKDNGSGRDKNSDRSKDAAASAAAAATSMESKPAATAAANPAKVLDGWQGVKQGRMANVYVERKLYKSKYDDSAFVQVRITNNTNSPFLLHCSSNLFFPCGWSGSDELPLKCNSDYKALSTNNPSKQDSENAGSSPIRSVLPHENFSYFAACRAGWAPQLCKDKYFSILMSGYCVVENQFDSEILSLSFEDNKPFVQVNVVIPNKKLAATSLEGGLLLAKGYRTAAQIRKQVIDDSLKIHIENETRAIARNSSDVSAYLSRAAEYLENGQIDKAKADCEAASRLDPNMQISDLKGSIYNELGQYDRAISNFDSNCDLYRAYSFFFKLQKYADAINYCSSSISNKENVQRALLLRGQIYESLGEYTKAIDDFGKALYTDRLNDEKISDYDKDIYGADADAEVRILHNAEVYDRRAALYRKLFLIESDAFAREEHMALAKANRKKAVELGFCPDWNSWRKLR